MVAPKLICPCPGDCKCDFIWGKKKAFVDVVKDLNMSSSWL